MLELNLRQGNIKEEDLLNDLRTVVEQSNQKTITRLQYDANGCFGATTIPRRIGTWNKALHLAGLGVKYRHALRLMLEHCVKLASK
jgi:hypothetical protein